MGTGTGESPGRPKNSGISPTSSGTGSGTHIGTGEEGATSSPTRPYAALCRNSVRREYERWIPWLAHALHLHTGIRLFVQLVIFCGILGNLRMGSESEQGEGDVVAPLTSSDFQSEDFLKLFPSPSFPGEEELWNCGPQSSWVFFWKPESWAWSFRGMFQTDFGVESCDSDFVTKGEACARGRLRPPINPKKTALQRLVCRLFGFKPNGRRPTYERWLSPVFLLRHQTDQGGHPRMDAACAFVVWYFGGTILLPCLALRPWFGRLTRTKAAKLKKFTTEQHMLHAKVRVGVGVNF